MSDEEWRALERALKNGDETARAPLTSLNLRLRFGRVLLWRDTEVEPLEGAQKAEIAVLIRPGRFVVPLKGYAIHVLDLDDVFRIVRSQPGACSAPAVMLDLPSGEAFEVLGTVAADAARSREERERRWRLQAEREGRLETSAQRYGVIAPRPRDEPYFDRQTLKPGREFLSFFHAGVGMNGEDGAPRSIYETNLYGYGGSLPRGHHFTITGISLIPDGDAPPDDLRKVRDHGILKFLLGACPHSTWPTRLVIPDRTPGPGDGSTPALFAPPMVQLAEKVGLAETQSFRFDLCVAPDVQRSAPVPLMLVLHGIHSRPLAG